MGLPDYSSHPGQHIWKAVIVFIIIIIFKKSGPDIFYQLLVNTQFALRTGHPTPLKSPI